jgi:hypothetical protein
MSSDPAVAPLDSQTNEVVETAAVSALETEGSEATSTAASANGDALPEQKGTSEASEKAPDIISESKGDAELAEGKGIADGAEAETPIEKLVVPTEMTFKETPARAWVVLVATFTAQLFTWGFLFAGGIWLVARSWAMKNVSYSRTPPLASGNDFSTRQNTLASRHKRSSHGRYSGIDGQSGMALI